MSNSNLTVLVKIKWKSSCENLIGNKTTVLNKPLTKPSLLRLYMYIYILFIKDYGKILIDNIVFYIPGALLFYTLAIDMQFQA